MIRKNRSVNKPGMTLVEVIIGLVIMGIAFYSLIAVFATLAPRTAVIENITKKTYLAQEKMEEYLANSFTNIISVDATSFQAPFSNYKYKIIVTNVASTELNTPVAQSTNYKNVKVRVWGGPVDLYSTIEVISLVTFY